MADFFRLPEKGVLINLNTVKKFDPKRSNRLDYTDGTHEQITDADAEALMGSLFRMSKLAEEHLKKITAKPRKKVTPKT